MPASPYRWKQLELRSSPAAIIAHLISQPNRVIVWTSPHAHSPRPGLSHPTSPDIHYNNSPFQWCNSLVSSVILSFSRLQYHYRSHHKAKVATADFGKEQKRHTIFDDFRWFPEKEQSSSRIYCREVRLRGGGYCLAAVSRGMALFGAAGTITPRSEISATIRSEQIRRRSR